MPLVSALPEYPVVIYNYGLLILNYLTFKINRQIQYEHQPVIPEGLKATNRLNITVLQNLFITTCLYQTMSSVEMFKADSKEMYVVRN